MTGRKPLLFLSLVFLTLSGTIFSQFQPAPVEISQNRIIIGGKSLYLHEVQKNQTLYGIMKTYKVGEEEIRKLNPELDKKSVYPGMVLRIPVLEKAEKSSSQQDEVKFINHTVQSKETLYSIARLYNIKVSEIRELNPDLKLGLKPGMVIKIPGKKILCNQENTDAAGQMLQPEKNIPEQDTAKDTAVGPCGIKPFPHVNDQFKLAILLPLNISQNDTLSYSDTLKPEHFRFYEFIEGVYLAIDSMKAEGLQMVVEVFDTERNPETIRRIIETGKLNGADLIIGPVFPNEIEVVSNFAKSNLIPMLSPFSNYDLVTNNPYAFQVRNKLPRQIELATSYLGSKYDHNVLVIGRLSEKSNPEFLRFLENLEVEIKEADPAGNATFNTIYFNESQRNFTNGNTEVTELGRYLSENANYIILPSENEMFITEVVNQLSQVSATHPIQVFGLNHWVFPGLDLGNLYRINLEVYSDFEDDNPFVDFNDPQVLNFCRKYRENWNIEPSKYSFHGFDIAWFFMNALLYFGHDLKSSVPCWTGYLDHPSILTPLRFQSNSDTSGYNNHAVSIVRYQGNELLRKKVN